MLCTEAAEVFPEYLVLKQARLDRVRRDAQRVSPAEDVREARLPKEEELAKSCAWGLPHARLAYIAQRSYPQIRRDSSIDGAGHVVSGRR